MTTRALYSGGKTGYLTFQVDVSGTDARLAAALSTGEPSDGRYETLRPGDSGEAVERLQKALMEWEPNVVSVTGTYDDGTRHAVDLYQQAQGIPVDGLPGRRRRPPYLQSSAPCTWKTAGGNDT